MSGTNNKPALHILFTMNCERAATRSMKDGPKNWQISARSIEGFCSRLLNAGVPATLFLSSDCAWEHAPLLEDLAERGVELAPYVYPKSLNERAYKHPLGKYSEEQQREIIELALERFREAFGTRPQSFRPAKFSANDATFRVLHELHFRQGSVSSPGSEARNLGAEWSGTDPGAHYVNSEDRLQAGDLPFLELPVTTDPTLQNFAGIPADLCIENGSFDEWHLPIIERNLERMAKEETVFRFLCIFSHNQIAYHEDEDPGSVTVEAMLDHLESLREHYEIVPTTLSDAHEAFRKINKVREIESSE